jgi:hypothetical protein
MKAVKLIDFQKQKKKIYLKAKIDDLEANSKFKSIGVSITKNG